MVLVLPCSKLHPMLHSSRVEKSPNRIVIFCFRENFSSLNENRRPKRGKLSLCEGHFLLQRQMKSCYNISSFIVRNYFQIISLPKRVIFFTLDLEGILMSSPTLPEAEMCSLWFCLYRVANHCLHSPARRKWLCFCPAKLCGQMCRKGSKSSKLITCASYFGLSAQDLCFQPLAKHGRNFFVNKANYL